MTEDNITPGEILPGDEPVTINDGRETITLTVANTGDRPVQVGSHFHFFEANRALKFDRSAAFGKRLDILAGTTIRFDPGERVEIGLVDIGGKRRVQGMNGLVNGSADSDRDTALVNAHESGFCFVDNVESPVADETSETSEDET